ncbi:hypothetical protein RRG08_056012 [Elysia crispata]|uniref:Uncharacterized protein n=1 Tax=Elysia crispata TaxID=231223 RepID=A0AAE1DY30_9GAST|nr:hypothetical protein RRG08_056012 [Elysia crispata]
MSSIEVCVSMCMRVCSCVLIQIVHVQPAQEQLAVAENGRVNSEVTMATFTVGNVSQACTSTPALSTLKLDPSAEL